MGRIVAALLVWQGQIEQAIPVDADRSLVVHHLHDAMGSFVDRQEGHGGMVVVLPKPAPRAMVEQPEACRSQKHGRQGQNGRETPPAQREDTKGRQAGKAPCQGESGDESEQ